MLRKRGKAWQVTVCWRGRVYRQSNRHWNRDQAAEAERALIEGLHATAIGKKPPRLLSEGIEQFKLEELPKMKPRTRAEAEKNLRYIAPDIGERMLTEARDAATAIRKRFAHLSPATQNRRVQPIARICALAFKEWGWLEKPVSIPMVAEPERDTFLTKAQVEKLARKCPRSGDAILVLAYTGIRKSQALALMPDRVRGGSIHLGREGKSGKPQLVPIHPRIKPIMRRLPLKTTLGILHKEWYAALKATGIKARLHDLRHTLASWMLQKGAGLVEVRDMLGHSSVAVTQRYTHLSHQHLRRAVNRI